MRRLSALAALPLLALLAAGCPKTPEAGGPPPAKLTPPERVEQLRQEGEALLRAQAELLWRTWTAGEAVDLSRPYAQHPGLFDDDALEAVRTVRAQAAGEDRRALDLLHDWLLSERVAEAVSEEEDALADFQAGAVVVVDGEPRPWRDLARLLAETEDAAERAKLHAAARPVLEEMAPLIAARDAQLDETARSLGYPTVAALAEDLRNVDLPAAAARAERVLDATDGLWRELLDRRARTVLGREADAASVGRADLPRLVVLPEVDARLPGDALVPAVERTLEGLGLPPAAQGRVRWETEVRPRKSPRALCVPVAVPGDLRLSVLPRAGLTPLRGLLGEAGACERLARVTAERFEFRRLGPAAWVDGFHRLFAGLAANPAWLSEHTPLADGDRRLAAEATAFERLLEVRRHAARVLLAAREAQGLDAAAADAAWQALSERAWGLATDPDAPVLRSLDRDPLLGSAEDLESALMAASLEAAAVRRFGEGWWRDPAAGAWLSELWGPGAALSPEALVERAWASAGGAPPAPEAALVETLRRDLASGPGA